MINYDIRVPMKDDVELSCDIYFAGDKKKAPIILLRTPYGKCTDQIQESALRFNTFGYHFVACDVRGRGDSGGKFFPYFNEALDGYSLIEWLSRQDFSDGNIITYGASYSARIQWLTAMTHPPHLKAMISIVSPSDPFVEDPTGYPSPLIVQWLFSISGRTMQNSRLVNWNDVFSSLPLVDLPLLSGRSIPFWREYFLNPPSSKFWDPLYYQKYLEVLDLPVMHISGWYDDEQIGTFINYIGMRNRATTNFAREHQALLIGPWPHNVNSSTRLGMLDFGSDAIIDLVAYECEWVNSILKKSDEQQDRVHIFLMGSNKWIGFSDWPIPGAIHLTFYLSSKGKANSSYGDGLLSLTPIYDSNNSSNFDEFQYDPQSPIPFITEQGFSQIGGPDDYSEIEHRNDILVYTTSVLNEPIILAGETIARLYVSTTAPDTDFTVKLVDLWPNGYAQRLNDGVVRLKYRNGFDREDYVNPNEILNVSVNLWNTFIRIPAGHRIRVEISSSAFPKYSRNQNIYGNQGLSSDFVSSTQRVYHNSAFPSNICVTVMK